MDGRKGERRVEEREQRQYILEQRRGKEKKPRRRRGKIGEIGEKQREREGKEEEGTHRHNKTPPLYERQ